MVTFIISQLLLSRVWSKKENLLNSTGHFENIKDMKKKITLKMDGN